MVAFVVPVIETSVPAVKLETMFCQVGEDPPSDVSICPVIPPVISDQPPSSFPQIMFPEASVVKSPPFV